MVYVTNITEPQWVMHWRIILEEFVTDINKIDRVGNILSDMLRRSTFATKDQDNTSDRRYQLFENELFAIRK